MKALLISAAVILVIAAGAHSQLIGRYAGVESPAATAIAPIAVPAILDQAGEAGSEVKLVLLALRPEGFETSEMQLDPGDYVFIIGNRTGLRDVSVRLDREGIGRIATAMVGGKQKDWKQRIKLTTGVYVVTANDNPNWTCRIVVGR
jgi:hypothetical protein